MTRPPRISAFVFTRNPALFPCMETDPKKLREIRLNQPRMTSEEFWRQTEMIQRAVQASREAPKPKSSAPGSRKAA